MRVYFDETWADVSMMKTGTGTYTLTAKNLGHEYEFKTTTNDARLFDYFGVADFVEVEYVTDAVRNLITEQLLAHQVRVGEMDGFFIGDKLWLPTPPAKLLGWGRPDAEYFNWGMQGYYLTPHYYDVYTSDEDGTMTIESFDTIAEAEEYAATNPLYRVDRWADLGIPFRF